MKRDAIALAAFATIVGALVAALGWPQSVTLYATIAVGAALLGVRVYVRIVGAENTHADETLEAIEDTIEDAAETIPDSPRSIAPKHRAIDRVGPASMLVLFVALGCADHCPARTAVDVACDSVIAPAVGRECAGTDLDDCSAYVAAEATCEIARREVKRTCH